MVIKGEMNIIIKKILKTFIVSFFGLYLPYFILFAISFLFYNGGSQVGYGAENFVFVAIFMSITPFVFTLFATFILLISSFIDKRVLNSWFIFLFGVYCFALAFLIKLSLHSLIVTILVSLVMTIIVLRVDNLIKSFHN